MFYSFNVFEIMKKALTKILGKKQSEGNVELSASEARVISDNFSCLSRAFARIRRKAVLGISEVVAPHLSTSDIKELQKLGYTVEEYGEGYKIKW